MFCSRKVVPWQSDPFVFLTSVWRQFRSRFLAKKRRISQLLGYRTRVKKFTRLSEIARSVGQNQGYKICSYKEILSIGSGGTKEYTNSPHFPIICHTIKIWTNFKILTNFFSVVANFFYFIKVYIFEISLKFCVDWYIESLYLSNLKISHFSNWLLHLCH